MVDVMAVVESSQSLSKALYKIELFIIKTIPYLLAIFYLLNTTLSYFYIDLPIISYIAGISFGLVFNRFYADCCYKGIAIEWEDML